MQSQEWLTSEKRIDQLQFFVEAENIEWDETDDEFEPENGDEAPESTLPTSLKFIMYIENNEEPDEELIGEHLTDWLSISSASATTTVATRVSF